MRLLEFQAKEVFSEYGISLLKGAVSTDIGKAREDAKMIGYPMVVKSQVPVGGRGKAGGIQICKNADELSIKYPQVMELEIKGERARAILIEEAAVIKNEMYLSLFLNRSKRCYTVIASAEGGVEIESVKNQIIKEVGRGNVDEQTASEIASEMGLQGKVADDFKNILVKLSKLTVEKEAELAEINPLAILDDGRMVALDGKMVTDDNSNYRHEEMHKYLERSEIEERAEKSGELDGDIAVIGCLVIALYDIRYLYLWCGIRIVISRLDYANLNFLAINVLILVLHINTLEINALYTNQKCKIFLHH